MQINLLILFLSCFLRNFYFIHTTSITSSRRLKEQHILNSPYLNPRLPYKIKDGSLVGLPLDTIEENGSLDTISPKEPKEEATTTSSSTIPKRNPWENSLYVRPVSGSMKIKLSSIPRQIYFQKLGIVTLDTFESRIHRPFHFLFVGKLGQHDEERVMIKVSKVSSPRDRVALNLADPDNEVQMTNRTGFLIDHTTLSDGRVVLAMKTAEHLGCSLDKFIEKKPSQLELENLKQGLVRAITNLEQRYRIFHKQFLPSTIFIQENKNVNGSCLYTVHFTDFSFATISPDRSIIRNRVIQNKALDSLYRKIHQVIAEKDNEPRKKRKKNLLCRLCSCSFLLKG